MVYRFRACRHYFFWGKGLLSGCRKSSCSSECLNHWAGLAESLTDRGRPGEEVVCRSSVSKGQGRQPGRLPSRPVSLEINQGLVTGAALLSHLVLLPVVPCYLWDLSASMRDSLWWMVFVPPDLFVALQSPLAIYHSMTLAGGGGTGD